MHARPGEAESPDAVISGAPHEILGLLSGHVSLAEARARGLELDGDSGVLARLRPAEPAGI